LNEAASFESDSKKKALNFFQCNIIIIITNKQFNVKDYDVSKHNSFYGTSNAPQKWLKREREVLPSSFFSLITI